MYPDCLSGVLVPDCSGELPLIGVIGADLAIHIAAAAVLNASVNVVRRLRCGDTLEGVTVPDTGVVRDCSIAPEKYVFKNV